MVNIGNRLHRMFDRFRRDTGGSVTIEYVMWMPIMAAGIALSMDASMLMHKQSNLFLMARDSARIVAVGQATAEEAKQHMIARLGPSYNVEVQTHGGFVTSTVSIQFKDVMMFGGKFTGTNQLAGQVTMYVEGSELDSGGQSQAGA